MMRRIETVLIAAVCAMSFMACSACGGGGSPTGPVSKTSQFFLPTGEPRNTIDPHVQVDSQGNLHFIYPAYSQGDAYYGYCSSNCTSADQVKVVQLKTQGTVGNARVALSADGRPQVLLSTFLRVYYATCTGDCTQSASWKVSPILEHSGALEVSGDAFTVTAEGKPRFIIHGFREIGGARVRSSYYMQCDSNCESQEGWTRTQISARNWEMGTLRLSATGQPRLVYAEIMDGGIYMSNYIECDSGCTSAANWKNTQLYRTFYGLAEEVPMYSAMSMRLTSQGKPRVAVMGHDGKGRNMVYLECDQNCGSGNQDNWNAQILLPSDAGGQELKAGLELALDAQNRPRLVYSANFNIVMGYCDSDCTDETKPTWKLSKVEFSNDMKKDNIIPYPDCTIAGGWFLNSPSIGIGKDGLPRIVYRAMDISGGGSGAPKGNLKCAAGQDMTFGRYTQLDSFREL